MSLAGKGAALAAVVAASFLAALVIRCGATRPLMDRLVESLLVVVVGAALYWALRRRFWVLLVVPATVIGLVYGDIWAGSELECGVILCR